MFIVDGFQNASFEFGEKKLVGRNYYIKEELKNGSGFRFATVFINSSFEANYPEIGDNLVIGYRKNTNYLCIVFNVSKDAIVLLK